MKNKYLNKFFCITMLSAMVLAIPTGVKAAEEADNVVAEEGVSGDGSEVSEPEPEVPAEPVPTAAPEPEITAAPDPEPTTAPEPTDTPTPAPTETPEPTATPAPTGTPEPTATPAPTATPEPTATPAPTATPEPTATPAPTATPEPTATPVPTATPARDDSAKVQAVIRKIKALAGRTITAADKAEINSVRAAYEALSNTEKAKVTNYKILTEAEAKLAAVDKNDSDNKKGNKKDNKKDDSSTEDNKNTEITDGNNATATQIGDPVYVTNMVSNLHAGKDFYLDSLKSNYHLSFSDDFASVMEEIEREYKEKNKLTDTENTLLVRNWQDILAVYIYEKSKAGATSFTLDASCKDDLARIFAEMNPIVRDKQDITKISYGNRKINYYIKKNNIAKKDRSVLKKYVETDCKLLCAVVTASKGFVRESVGDNVSEDRVDVITAAYSLVGKVGYFWGGKSTVIGEDPSWGSVEKVSADGSRSSGTLRAYGLDCSGFVTWAVINGYKDQGMQAAVGDGTSDQWEKAGVVSEADAQPGDLVFQRGPEAGSNNHVGILCGKTDSGDWIAVHCSSSKNGVTVGEAYSASFRYIRKPSFYQDTTAEENETTATENDVLTEESAEKLLTDVVRSDALKDALASGDTVSSDLLADFKNKALQEDEEEDEVETLTLDQETMDDAVDTFDDDVETLEMEN